jgi:hypothetical protein
LATERQQDELLGRTLPGGVARALRVVGWGLLLVALAAAVRNWGWAFGLVAYSGHTSVAAGVVYAAALLAARRRANAASGAVDRRRS